MIFNGIFCRLTDWWLTNSDKHNSIWLRLWTWFFSLLNIASAFLAYCSMHSICMHHKHTFIFLCIPTGNWDKIHGRTSDGCHAPLVTFSMIACSMCTRGGISMLYSSASSLNNVVAPKYAAQGKHWCRKLTPWYLKDRLRHLLEPYPTSEFILVS